tara:strand:+ start:4587 stop:5330 length:744 start_codon:yes stop_codon:yes gene_type:complete
MFKFKGNKFKILGIIPSRLYSKRLPKKALIKINGEPLISRVYRLASKSKILDSLIVATDSNEIVNLLNKVEGRSIMTSEKHANGTERMGEVIKNLNEDYDIYVLINGDEALLDPDHIEIAVKTLIENDSDASMLVCKFYKRNSPSDFKVVLNAKNELLYISRSDIPSESRNSTNFLLKAYHIMAFKEQTIIDYSLLEKTRLESIEDHEHLRLLENGYKISCSIVNSDSISVDTESDLKFVIEQAKKF